MDIFHKQLLKNDYQDVFQISDVTQKLDHIFHNKLCSRYCLRVFSQFFVVISAYKDPVENQSMVKILDKFVTGFFIVMFGILWHCSSKYYIKLSHYSVVVYDIFGKQSKIEGVRTRFKTVRVAQSFISEYQKRFSGHSFSIAQDMLQINNMSYRIFKKIQR